MSKKRKRISRRRLAGQRVLAHVSTHHLETGEYKPVTAARRYIAEAGLVPPALLNVRRNEQGEGFVLRPKAVESEQGVVGCSHRPG